ncbi:hypothetical protein ACFWGE_12200 [Streptomyces bacillaris]|uniref:hypothetical protein n=1 Tax=Streptomyces TaxID=1883 RepID=UPI00158750FA|nr:hypothetical protein [Streptomyces sp. KAI-26]NUV90617.1 hypothetical protein [Streptomyces sp. KAI-26]NUW24783.1 hypothetical protein [Streptomyces roseoviolaceus]
MPQLFLNEKSCETKADPERVNRAMTDMVEAVLAVAAVDRQGTALITQADSLLTLQLAPGHPIGKWMGAPGTDEVLRLRLKKLDDRSPYRTVFPEGETFSDVGYQHDGETVAGLGFAHLLGGVGISLPVEPRWDADRITLVQERLTDDEGTGSVSAEVDVRHAARAQHVDTHLKWIERGANTARQKAVEGLRSGTELWELCPELFPLLQFTPDAEGHFGVLPEVWVRPVGERLGELQDAVSDWDPEQHPIAPQWRSDVRTEFEMRRKLCWFPDTDGESRLFDWHCEFLPKPGRMHFRLLHEERTLRIAYVGRKRGIK